jgi:hypothetical protein
MTCTIIPSCPISLPIDVPEFCPKNTMVIEYRNYNGCDLIANTILPNGDSIGWECSASTQCISAEVIPISSSCIAINRITVDMDCLQTTNLSGNMSLNACWFSTISPSAFSITVAWRGNTQTIFNTTNDQSFTCCVNPVATITYGLTAFNLQAIIELYEPIYNGFGNAIVTSELPYPYDDSDTLVTPIIETPYILLPPGASSISGSMPNAIVTYSNSYPDTDLDTQVNINTYVPVLLLPAGASSISGGMPTAIVSYDTTYPTTDVDTVINKLITYPSSGVYL